jgi:ubiquinone biosynthesis protein COQ9
MVQTDIRDRIVAATLPHAAIDGWTERALAAGLDDAGFPKEMALRAFPGGMAEVVRHWSGLGDRRMADAWEERDREGLRLRDRVSAAVRLRIEVDAGHREAVRRALSFLALPQNAEVAALCLRDTVNAIWYTVGDTSADYTYYTKRALLTAVYGATVLYWLNDDSPRAEETWAFLDRRLDDAMKIPRLQSRVTGALARLAGPLSGRAGRGFRTRRFL